MAKAFDSRAQEELNDRKVEVLLDAPGFLTLPNHNSILMYFVLNMLSGFCFEPNED